MINVIEQIQNLDLKNPWIQMAVITVLFGILWLVLYTASDKPRVAVDKAKSVVIVTGCDSGFGLGLANKLTTQGYRVVATCMTKEGVARLKTVVEVVLICDVTKEDNIATLSKAVTTYLNHHSDYRLWALINNAGIPLSGMVDWLPMDAFRHVMDVNYFAPIRLVKEFLPLLKRRRGSRIINLSSLAGYIGGQFFGPYSASKHAMEGVGKAMRDEFKPWGIQVAHINPGFMRYENIMLYYVVFYCLLVRCYCELWNTIVTSSTHALHLHLAYRVVVILYLSFFVNISTFYINN